MSGVSRKGVLQDYIPRPGDQRPDLPGRSDSRNQKWGGRRLISNYDSLRAIGVGTSMTLVETGDLGRPRPINIQLRFADNSTGTASLGQPVLPFQNTMLAGAARLRVDIRRGGDKQSPPTTDTYYLFGGAGSGQADVLPIDIITASQVGVDVYADFGSNNTVAWVEAIASPVAEIGPYSQVHPWDQVKSQFFIAASNIAQPAIVQDANRVQFILCNTSTNSNMGVGFESRGQIALLGPVPAFGPPPTNMAMILPPGQYATYESPTPGCFKGTVWVIWDQAVPDGGCLVTEGTKY